MANRINVDALNELDDKRIKNIKPLIPPQILMEDHPLTTKAAITVETGSFISLWHRQKFS
jgi:3-deoxy-7-phosphoheptulonate synthase